MKEIFSVYPQTSNFPADLCNTLSLGDMLLVLVKKTVLFHFSSPPTKFPHDITTQRELTALFNMRVVKATRCERPLQGQKHRFGPVKHSGVVVTLADGRTFLVHKVIVTMFSYVVTYHYQIS